MKNKFNLKGKNLYFYAGVLIVSAILFLPWTRDFFLMTGWRWLYILLISFVLSFCLTPVCGWIAVRNNILDRPNARKLHQDATPLLGGVAVFSAFLIAIIANGIFSTKLGVILIAAAVLCAVGVADDVREVPAGLKLLVQISAAAGVMSFGIILNVVPDSLGMLAGITNILLTLLWIVGITNAMNFFDGMDGLAIGLSGLIAFFLGVVAFQTAQPFLGWVSVALVGSCLGFLPFNFRYKKSAVIFLGDAGSTVLGFILACVAVYGKWSENDPVVAIVSPVLIFWILIFDMVHITVDRIIRGKVVTFRDWIDYVGKDHLHHRIGFVLGDKQKSVLFLYFLSFCLGTSAIVLRNATPLDALLLIFQAVIMMLLITVLERRGRSLSEVGNDIEPR